MKAAIYRQYGSAEVVTIDEVPTPVPRDHEVVIRIHAATVGVVDSLARQGAPFYARTHFGLRRPRFPTLGTDFAGQVEAIGPGVTKLAAGDQVFGTTAPRFGAHADFVSLSEHAAVAPKPTNVTYAEAAALADTMAVHFLRDKANLQRGQTILINGASGAVGAAAVQLAKHLGAIVTGVCGAASAGLVRELGAGAVIDYTADDFASSGATYDVIFDVVGKRSFAGCRAALTPSGVFVTTAPSPAILLRTAWTSMRGTRFKSETRKAMVAFEGCGGPPTSGRTCSTSRIWLRRQISRRSSTRVSRCTG